jgi:MFS family permease
VTDSLSTPTTYSLAQRAVLASIALSGLLVPLNSTMIAVALPDIMQAFGATMNTAGWLVTAYLITMAGLQLVTGQLGDRFGRRRLLLGGTAYFGLASLLAALSPSLGVLLFARVQQAVAGAILITNGIALAFESGPESRRGTALGVVTAVLGLAAAAGPALGGLLVSLAGWRAMFWANIPIVIAALLFGLPFAGSGVLEARPRQTSHLINWLEISALFRNKTFALANGSIMFSNLAMYVALLAIPILMSSQRGWSSLRIGLLLAVMSVTTAFFSPIGGRLSDRLGRRVTGVAGMALLSLGVVPLAILGNTIYLTPLLVCLSLIGIGLGLSSVSLQTFVLESVELQRAGLATGISSTSRYLGSIVGSKILALILGLTPITVTDFRMVFLVVTIAACSALLLSLGIGNEGKTSSFL